MVTGHFLIGNAKIYIDGPEKMLHPENLERFRMNEKTNEAEACRYMIHIVDDFLPLKEHLETLRTGPICKREDLTVFQTKTGECRLMNFKGADWCYAASLQKKVDVCETCEIWFLREIQSQLFLDTIFWAPFCLERLMIGRGGIVLHSAYMARNEEAVLFSAPSGTGKSTQAALWETYRHTRTINGDRTLLMKKNDIWRAYGWPICGSSEICINESFPIRAIVMLCQAKTNQIRKLHGFEAVRNVFAQLMVNGWSRTFQEKAVDLLDDLLQEIPVFLLSCDISKQAVECLEKTLGDK